MRTALLKVILAKQKQSNRFVSLQAKSQSGMFISTLLAGFIGGILYDQQPDWPFILSILSSISSIVFIYLIDERDKISLEPPNSGGQKSNKAISHYTLNSNQIFWTYFYAISRTFTITPFLLIYPLYFMYVNVEPILFGIVLSLFTLSAYVVTVYSKKIIDIYGKLKTLVVMFSLMQIAFFSLWVANISQPLIALDYFLIGLFSITCLGLGSGAIRPITMANIDLSNTPLLEQVKIFTKMEKLFGILNSFLIVFCGILITVFDLQNTIFVLAILYLVSMYCLKVFANPDIKSS